MVMLKMLFATISDEAKLVSGKDENATSTLPTASAMVLEAQRVKLSGSSGGTVLHLKIVSGLCHPPEVQCSCERKRMTRGNIF
jgi:hypothetical protein